MGYGRQVLAALPGDIQVIAGGNPEWKFGGVTLDWSKVAALGSDTTYLDGLVVKSGQKVLRYGQVLTRISNPTVLTLSVAGTPTGGSFKATFTRRDTGSQLTVTVPFNATAAVLQGLLDGLFGAGNTLVAGGPLPGTPLTITAQGALQYVTIGLPSSVDNTLLQGGTTPAASFAATNAGTNTGWYGPYDPAASDGRQTLARDGFGVVNTSILQQGVLGTFTFRNPDQFGVLVGGPMFKGRVIATAGTHSLAAGPTYAELEGVSPSLRWVG